MRVGLGKKDDKDKVLEFCKDTFSWGDYIADVWDYWFKEGNLFVGYQNNQPIAVCHVSVHKKARQIWIEGIRVHPNFRKMGLATKLVSHSESVGAKNNCKTSLMLIEVNNKNSISLAKKQNYKKKETWFFCSLEPKKTKASANLANFEKKIPSNLFTNSYSYVRSWRWMPLEISDIKFLIKKRKIFFIDFHRDSPFLIITDSEHFTKTLMVTLYSNSTKGVKQLLNHVQNLAFNNNYNRIQVLCKIRTLPKIIGLKNRLSFYLMEKKI